MTSSFEVDPYPGNPKILFIGLGVSSHTHLWVDLLADSKLNVRMFSVPEWEVPPSDWNVRTYVCEPTSYLPQGLDLNTRKSLHPTPEEVNAYEIELEKSRLAVKKRYLQLRKNIFYWISLLAKKGLNFIGEPLGLPHLQYNYDYYRGIDMPKLALPKAASAEEWLAEIIQNWQPDIIHTLGVFNSQGGQFYFNVRKKYKLEMIGKWVLQLFGGSDLTLVRHNPETAKQLFDIFSECDQVVDDNNVSLEYCKTLGFAHKVASIAPVPGAGGLDVDLIKSALYPSKRERIILWSKAYESKWSKARTVQEAIMLAWDSIKPCRIIITVIAPEVREWLLTLPQEILSSIEIRGRIPRDELLALMRSARVLIATSLIDGVPSMLYEAMATGAFPIVSPLDTIKFVVKDEVHVLFARNLYPLEIRDALIRAMNDDDLVDSAYKANMDLAQKIASRKLIRAKAVSYYQRIGAKNQ